MILLSGTDILGAPSGASRPGAMLGRVEFTEAELTIALTAAGKATLAAQSREIRKGRVDVEDAWRALGGYGRYQLLHTLGDQLLPVLASLPDVARVHGERPSYSAAQVRAAVAEHAEDAGGRLRRQALVLARTALVQTALSALPPWHDPGQTAPGQQSPGQQAPGQDPGNHAD